MTEPEHRADVHPRMRSLNPTVLALLGGVVVLLMLIAYFVSNRNPDQDKLTGPQITKARPAASSDKRCASQATFDLIKRDLFRRAAQLRGADEAAYDKLAAYAVARMENPVLEGERSDSGSVNCSGSLSLDLPPGVAVAGGRHTLMSSIDYTVQAAADGSGLVVLLRNADAIVAPLATLGRVQQPTPTLAEPAEHNTIGPGQPSATTQSTSPPAPTAPPRLRSAQPSFNCASPRSRNEAAVCSDPGLAALERNMSEQFEGAMANASFEQQVLLRRSRDRFEAYFNRCPNNACISDAYVGRIREIRDIMEGRWRAR